MYLEAVLNGSNKLGSTTQMRWNIYRERRPESKNETAASGLRADMNIKITGKHEDSLFPSASTTREILCTLHAIARCVQKLLNSEC